MALAYHVGCKGAVLGPWVPAQLFTGLLDGCGGRVVFCVEVMGWLVR